MSIIIQGMEMPESCYECDFAYQDQDSEHNVEWICAALHRNAQMYERREDCPLLPLPEKHGRLIDADALFNGEHNLYSWYEIDEAPTVIPAEGEK